MPTVTPPRAEVTADEVGAVLREQLGPRYKIKPGMTSRFHYESQAGANSILVRRHWFEQASIRVVPGPGHAEIRIGSAANITPAGICFNHVSIVRKVHQVLQHATGLASS
jgi:hypothetical protein